MKVICGPGHLEGKLGVFKFSLRPLDIINEQIFNEHYGKFGGKTSEKLVGLFINDRR